MKKKLECFEFEFFFFLFKEVKKNILKRTKVITENGV
jgi:hypothetical protein